MRKSGEKSTVQRRVIILNQLEAEGQVDVISLSKTLEVSEVTIRNDLKRLEQKNALIRARGGAIKIDRVGIDFALSAKNKQNYEQKRRIGKAAAELVEEGDTIILDSGTTTMEITKNLANIIIPGGFLRKNSLSLIGATAEESFKNYFCDKLFLAVDGFSAAYGLSTPNVEEAHLNRVMMAISKQVIVVADSSKFHKRSFAFIAPISDIDILVTDSGIPTDDQKKLESAGIKIIIV